MSETEIAVYEACRNDAMDTYFNARPQLLRTREQECLFEAGFKKAYEQLQATNKELLDALEKDYTALKLLGDDGRAVKVKNIITNAKQVMGE